MVNVTPMKEL